MPTTQELKDKVANEAKAASTDAVTSAADTAKSTFANATSTVSGQIAGQVQGGIQSVSQKVDAFKGDLADAKSDVEGLLSGDTTAIKNMATDMVENAIGGLLSKFGAKVEVEFSEPDSNGVVHPLSSSLSTDTTAADKIQGVLSLITGLGIGGGNLQSIAAVASPQGLLDAGKDLVAGKIGAFDGADAIKNLANDTITSVTNDLVSSVNAGLAQASNLGKSVQYITDYDSNGTTFATVTSSVGDATGSSGRTDSAEFNDSITNLVDNTASDLNGLITKANEASLDLEGAKTDLENLSGGVDGAEVLSSVQNQNQNRQTYVRKADEYRSLVKTRVSDNSETGVIQGLNTDTVSALRKRVKVFCLGIPDSEVDRIIALSQGDATEESQALRLLQKNSGKTFDECKRFLKTIDSTITTATKPKVDAQVFSTPYLIGSYDQEWKSGKGDPVFPYISSTEELQAEIKSIKREVESVIVHWSETHTNKNIGSEEINKIHLDLGLDGIGYHYIIRRDGSLQRGRPVNLEGQHTPGVDDVSIGICFIGGINAPTGTPNAANFLSSQSLTRSQINTFDHFCRSVYNIMPGIEFLGHADVDLTGENIDPGFDVPDYVLTRFGK